MNDLPLRDVRADIEPEPEGLTFQELSGAGAQWRFARRRFSARGRRPGRPACRSFRGSMPLDMRALLVHWLPPLRDRFAGRLDGQARFEVAGADGVSVKEALIGSGQAHDPERDAPRLQPGQPTPSQRQRELGVRRLDGAHAGRPDSRLCSITATQCSNRSRRISKSKKSGFSATTWSSPRPTTRSREPAGSALIARPDGTACSSCRRA